MAKGRYVLVIDDDASVRSAFARVLAREGYTVKVAATATEALGHVAQERPDAILLDLRMPLINGVGFLYRLREDPANQNIAVAIVTGALELDSGTVEDLHALNAQVWQKPLSLDDIRRLARTLMTPETPPVAGPESARDPHIR